MDLERATLDTTAKHIARYIPENEVIEIKPLVNRLNVITGIDKNLIADSILKSDNRHILLDIDRHGNVWIKRNSLK
jgi:hypothetical protein